VGSWSVEFAFGLLADVLEDVVMLLGPYMLALIVAALAVNIGQTGPVFSTKALVWDFNRLNPVDGLKRTMSIKGLFDSAKGIVKLALLFGVLYGYIKDELPDLLPVAAFPPKVYPALLLTLCGKLMVKLSVILLILATVDFAFVRWKYRRDLRMSKHDVKQEYKQREGDPRVRGRMRELRRQMLKRTRSISNVRDADVVITNPTHIAVALRYKHGESLAPQLVAKGAGDVARRIRDMAGRYQIPVVQNPSLARALYREIDFDAYLPEKWFSQVVKILIWVYAMRQVRHPAKGE
jgi:flagellar biosynthetic protein FlhB